MKIRRYYEAGGVYAGIKRVYYPEINDFSEYLKVMMNNGYTEEEAITMDTAQWEFLLSEEEQATAFFDCLQRVQENPRYYLDNLDNLPVFRVDITKIFPHPIRSGIGGCSGGMLSREKDESGKRVSISTMRKHKGLKGHVHA